MKLSQFISGSFNPFNSELNTRPTYDVEDTSRIYGQKFAGYKPASDYVSGPVYDRIALDVSSVDIDHYKRDQFTNHLELVKNGSLHNLLTRNANIDQSPRDLLRELVSIMFETGSVALVPTETSDENDGDTESNKIKQWRVGKIIEWNRKTIKVNLFNEETQRNEDVLIYKTDAAIIYNPLTSRYNEGNSTLERLINKLGQIDMIDSSIAGNRLNLLVQSPYQSGNAERRKEETQHILDIEKSLSNSKHGIAYVQSDAKITQLGQPIEAGILDEIKYLTAMFYNEYGLSEAIFNGTASKEQLLSYYTRSIDPIVSAIVDEINRKFISDTAHTQGQIIIAHRDPFKLIPMNELSNIADSFRRNQILTTNEIRTLIGFEPSDDERGDDLLNPNIADVNQDTANPNLTVDGNEEPRS